MINWYKSKIFFVIVLFKETDNRENHKGADEGEDGGDEHRGAHTDLLGGERESPGEILRHLRCGNLVHNDADQLRRGGRTESSADKAAISAKAATPAEGIFSSINISVPGQSIEVTTPVRMQAIKGKTTPGTRPATR